MSAQFPLGSHQAFHFRYCDSVSIDASTGVAADYVLNASSLYDPDVTGTGHQPYGFDQLMAFFRHYVVVKARVKVTAVSNVTPPIWVAVHLNDRSTSLAGEAFSYVRELPRTKMFLIAPSPAPAREIQSIEFRAEDFFDCDPLDRDELAGTSGTSPTEAAYFHVMVLPQLSTDNPAGQVVGFELDQWAVLTEPALLTGS